MQQCILAHDVSIYLQIDLGLTTMPMLYLCHINNLWHHCHLVASIFRREMEAGESSDESGSYMSDDLPHDDIASPDPVQDTVQPVSSETFAGGKDERSQTPLQDEEDSTTEQVAEVTETVEELNASHTLQQSSQQGPSKIDVPARGDNEVVKQTVRDDHEELDYDEEVQADGCLVSTVNGNMPSHQKTEDDKDVEHGEEKVDFVVAVIAV